MHTQCYEYSNKARTERKHTSYRLLCQEFSTPVTQTNSMYLHILIDGQEVVKH